MVEIAWKIPRRWTRLNLTDRTALYPALYLRWAGRPTALGREVPPGQWNGARLRVLVTDGDLADDERDLLAMSAARGVSVLVSPQAGVADADAAFMAELGFPMLAWSDEGPLASAAPQRPGHPMIAASGCAARAAEDRILFNALMHEAPPAGMGPEPGCVLIAAGSLSALAEIQPALDRWPGGRRPRIVVTSESDAVLSTLAAQGMAVIPAADPGLLALMGEALVFLCACQDAPADSPKPGQWVRSALFQGAPVVAASHPSLDGLAELCVLDDWERGLKLRALRPAERLEAIADAQAMLAPRLRPERVAAEWSALIEAQAAAPVRARRGPSPPLLLVLIDIHQDLDVLLPVLLALQSRGEMRLRIAVTDWLVAESPRVLNILAAHHLDFDIHPREAVQAGEAPSLAGADGVLAGAETNVRPHKAGHSLVSRANARGLATFTLQHGLENIGLTYKDQQHGEDVRFAAATIFTWGARRDLAPWTAPETRAAVVPVGSPKSAPAPAHGAPLNQGHWARTVGVFENLHWRRFDEAYRQRVLDDLGAAAAAHEDTLFLIKPHHAGRWTSRNRALVGERPNLVVVDPTDSAWEPHTAPALIASVDAVLTTPSTVALDAARTGRPVAVFGYDLDLPLYAPLPIVRGLQDLEAFLADEGDDWLMRNEGFLQRARLPGRADHRIAARIAKALRARRTQPGRRRELVRG